jgi:hypothetical protein
MSRAARCLSGSSVTRAHPSPSGSASCQAPASGAAPTGTGARACARWWSMALRWAMVSTQARRLESGRSRG